MFNQLSFIDSSVPGVLWYICAKQATWMSKPWSSSSWVETDLTQFVEGCTWEKLDLISAALCSSKGSWTSLNSSCCSTYRMTGEGPANCSPGPQVQPAAGKSSGFFISAEAKSQPCSTRPEEQGGRTNGCVRGAADVYCALNALVRCLVVGIFPGLVVIKDVRDDVLFPAQWENIYPASTTRPDEMGMSLSAFQHTELKSLVN